MGVLLLLTVGLILRGLRDSAAPPSPMNAARPVVASPTASPLDARTPDAAAMAGAGNSPREALPPTPAPVDASTASALPQATIATRRTTPVAPPPTRRVSLEAAAMEVSEGAFAAVITVRRSGNTRGIVSFAWRVEGSNAVRGQDFGGAAQGTARFTSGQNLRTIYVPLIDDAEREGPEAFTVSVRPTSNAAAAGEVTRTIVTINDDD